MEFTDLHLIFKLLACITCFLLFYCSTEQQCAAILPTPHNTVHARNRSRPLYALIEKKTRDNKTNKQKKTHGKNKVSFAGTDGSENKEPWSNAFNFKKSWGTQVDPRTGTLTSFIKAGSMISNLDHGPNINLQIDYSSDSTANPDGIAMGWSWNLTHFNPITNQLTTSTGNSFHLIQSTDGTWHPLYHRLKDILIQGNKASGFTITYTNGLREKLDKYGYETRLEQQNGWGVNFLYDDSGKHLLRTIEDDQKHKINISFNAGYITVTSYGTYGQPVTVRIDNSNTKLNDVSLPLEKNDLAADIHISYSNNRIVQTDYPTGLTERFEYNCNGAIRLPHDNSMAGKALCAVSQEAVSLNGQQNNTIHYEYSAANANEHDYFGFNSGLTLVPGSVKDILFEAPVDYTYQTTEDNNLVKEVRTYNKYHLLIDDKKISDNNQHILSEIQNFYCRTDKLNGCAQTSFDKLPITYSLPLKVITKLWGNSYGTPDVSSVAKAYDNSGRVISSTDSYGRTKKIIYCPISGDASCPKAPKDWPYNNLPEKTTVYPAKTGKNTTALPPIVTYYHYQKVLNHNDNGYMLVLDHQIQQSGDQKTTISRSYYTNPAYAFTYGLLKKTVMSGSAQGVLTAVSKDYRYIESTDGHSKTAYECIESDKNKSLPLPTTTTSMFTNQVLQRTDASGKNIIRYHYDSWGRLIQTDRAVGTLFATHTYYQYMLSPSLNSVLITAADGLQQKLIMDSAGRQTMVFDEAVSTAGKKEPGKWLLKEKTTYDRYGQVAANYSYLSDVSGNTHSLETTYQYDNMGAISEEHLSNGETRIKQYNDPLRCMVSYIQDSKGQRSSVSVVTSNAIGEPKQEITLPATQTPLSSIETLCKHASTQPGAKASAINYDGFGRMVTVTDPMGKTIQKTYNSLGQLTDVINPAGDKMHYVYNILGNIIQTWYLPHSGGKYLLSSAQYNAAGELLWDAGEDGKRTTYTYTSDGKPLATTTPAGHVLSLQYNVLNLPIAKYLDGKLQLQTEYDPVTLLPVKKTDNTGVTTWTYTDDHLPQQEKHTGSNGYPDYQLQWQYDQNRRIISATDIHGNKTFTRYDALGRVSALYYKNSLLSAPSYDGFSRIIAVHYGSGMQRTIGYDSYSHPYRVKDTLNGQLLSQWNYTYDTDNNIIQINQQAENNKTGVINYQYDNLDNLISMRCNGSSGLPLCPRDTDFSGSGLKTAPLITRQYYSFTALNRIAQVKEVLQNADNQQTLSKMMTYNYSNANTPLRLQSISTNWNKESPVTNHFSYDVTGNMTLDGKGNKITYNAFDQVTSVIKPDGTHSFYGYDGEGREVTEKTAINMHYLFYQGTTLINENIVNPEQVVHSTGYYGIAKTIDGVMSQYYERDYKGDVTAVLTQEPKDHGQYQLSRRNVYSPYGMSWHRPSSFLSLQNWQKPLTGFDGERTDPATGWQFLGAGHRSYNPAQRYFVSEDPAGDGYRFGSNNPIMKTDPTGNMPHWLGKTIGVINDVATFGLALLHKKWANVLASVVMAGLTVVCIAAAVDTYGGTLAVAAAAGTAAVLSSVSIAAAAVPTNKGLSIAGAVTGVANMALSIATAAPLIYSTLSNIADKIATLTRSGNLLTTLGQSLKTAVPTLRISRSIFTILRRDYLTLNSDEELAAAWGALKQMPGANNSDVSAALITAKMTGRPLNLAKLENYITTVRQFNGGIDTENTAYIDEAAQIAKSRKVLFSQFGRFVTKKRLLAELLYHRGFYRANGSLSGIIRAKGTTFFLTGSRGYHGFQFQWIPWILNDNNELIRGNLNDINVVASANLFFK